MEELFPLSQHAQELYINLNGTDHSSVSLGMAVFMLLFLTKKRPIYQTSHRNIISILQGELASRNNEFNKNNKTISKAQTIYRQKRHDYKDC